MSDIPEQFWRQFLVWDAENKILLSPRGQRVVAEVSRKFEEVLPTLQKGLQDAILGTLNQARRSALTEEAFAKAIAEPVIFAMRQVAVGAIRQSAIAMETSPTRPGPPTPDPSSSSSPAKA
jgi:hypothetical protein